MHQDFSVGALRRGPSVIQPALSLKAGAPRCRHAPRSGRTGTARGFTAIEVLVVLVIAFLLLSLLLPALSAARGTARKAANGSNLRSIGQGLAIAANSNKEFYAGLTSKGEIGSIGKGHALSRFGNTGDDLDEKFSVDSAVGSGDNPAVRLAILLQSQVIAPEILLNPIESSRKWEADERTPMSSEHYSYAMLALGGVATDRDTAYTPPVLQGDKYGRPATRGAAEWKSTQNTEAVTLADRNTGEENVVDPDQGRGVSSVWVRPAEAWQGHVVKGDVSIEYRTTHYMARTRYGNNVAFDAGDMDSGSDGRRGDNLFYVNDNNNDGESGHNADAVGVYPIADDNSGNPVLGTTTRHPNPQMVMAEPPAADAVRP
ncbi:MAG: hypothetical protein AAF288_06945 [Planctomycetota bacterium]